MPFVDRMERFAAVGAIIRCPEMILRAGDHQPPVVVGVGEFVVHSTTSFCYRIQGMPEDVGHALRALNRIRADPYDGRLRERLEVRTEDGTQIQCGWTMPNVELGDQGGDWIFTGEFEALTVSDDGPAQLSTNVAYLLPKHHRARVILRRFFPTPNAQGQSTFRMSIIGTEVIFTLHDEADLLLIQAPGNGRLKVTLTENWLGEPLRILFGQLIYPRFVARCTGSQVMNWVRPSPRWSSQTDACALWQGDKSLIDRDGFWDYYARLLAHIASIGDFEASALSNYYVEVIQAASGSRWVWALTYASAAEGLVSLIFPRGSRRSDMSSAEIAKFEEEVDDFIAYIDSWTGDATLKSPAKAAASRMLDMSAAIGLRQLRDEAWVTSDQYKAWRKLRNSVMHGTLVSPYSSAEDDKLLLDLSDLLHALTRRIIASINPATGIVSAPSPLASDIPTDVVN